MGGWIDWQMEARFRECGLTHAYTYARAKHVCVCMYFMQYMFECGNVIDYTLYLEWVRIHTHTHVEVVRLKRQPHLGEHKN